VLNEGFGVNFFQFINAYRVAEAQRLLASAQHQHLSMVGIAFEAGFSSKTTFNTTFKKLTGLTPSQFLQQVRAGEAPLPEPPGRAWLPPMGSVG
jgi:AraC-like DNA-binding protein